MRTIIWILIVFFATGVLTGNTTTASAKDDGIEVVDEIEVVEPGEGGASGVFLGVPKYRWMTITGPIVWLSLALAVLTRYVRIKGKARQLLKVHKFFGYTAICLGTFHGLFGLLL